MRIGQVAVILCYHISFASCNSYVVILFYILPALVMLIGRLVILTESRTVVFSSDCYASCISVHHLGDHSILPCFIYMTYIIALRQVYFS